jgi:hypothetical protein
MRGSRGATLKLGERMMLCACTAVPAKDANSHAAAIDAGTARVAITRQLAPSCSMKPQGLCVAGAIRRPPYGVATATLMIFSACSLLIRPAI